MTDVGLVLASSTGGIGTHVASLAAGLTARGARVAVLGPAATEARFDFTARGALFLPVEVSAAAGTVALRRALTALGPDVVHAHGLRAGLAAGLARPPRRKPSSASAPASAPASANVSANASANANADVSANVSARLALVPLVVTWHNGLVHGGLDGWLHRLIERQVARRADVTLGASTELVARALAVGGRDVRAGPIAAPELPAPSRDPAAVRAELGLADGQPLVLSVGRLHPHKGYDLLIAAASRWRARTPPPLVAIAGTGPAFDQLVTLVSDGPAPVRLLGHRDDVPDLLGAADLAVVTSVLEARQMFAQEALRAGVPLVTTAVGGLPELVGDAAVLVPPRNVDALDAAVTALLDDPARRATLARLGRRQATTWPTEAQTVDQVQALYAELTGQPVGR